jgi:very-long-chain enoyl-CoA reductase
VRCADELEELGLKEGTIVELKNLGTQLPYRLLFLSEYFGPIPIMAFFGTRPELIYGAGASELPRSNAFSLAMWAFILHFVKRELETLFLHKFSKPSVPLAVFVRNNIYYWGFAALVAYFVCHPAASSIPDDMATMYAAAMGLMELGNFTVHSWFASQRKADKDASRPVPSGALFFVSCPNYFFEMMSWVFFSLLANNHPAAWAFTVAGAGQMAQWAMERHKAYRVQEKKEGAEGTGPAHRRSAMIPFLW